MKISKCFLFFISICFITNLSASNVLVTDFNAIGDGKTLDTKSIQNAIDFCSESGGGKVIFPSGKSFLSGTIHLKDNVTLYFEKASSLLGSSNFDDYNPKNLIRAYQVNNIGIAGKGTIDGQGHYFWNRKPDLPKRKKLFGYRQTWQYEHVEDNPGNLIQIEDCKNIRIEDITLKNAESWTLHLLACHTVIIDGIKIRNPFIGPNTDGIDIHHTSNVVIANCDIFTADDAIVLKTGDQDYLDRPCRNITITNCILTNLTSSIKTGTGTYGNFENIVISNCVLACGLPTDEGAQKELDSIDPDHWGNALGSNTGIAINCVDGGSIKGFHVSNIVMQGIRCPIFIRLSNRVKDSDRRENPVAGSLQNVKISQVTAYDAALASSITGIPGHDIQDVSLTDIYIQTKGGAPEELTEYEPAEREDKYPKSTMWGNLHVSGLFVRHVKDITLKDIKITLDNYDPRPLIDFWDVKDLYFDHLGSDNKTLAPYIISLRQVQNAVFQNVMLENNDSYWFSLIGNENRTLKISGNTEDLSGKINYPGQVLENVPSSFIMVK